MTADSELLRQYVEDRSQRAFRELVERRINLVYSVAFRQTNRDSALAQDVTQTVFVDLANQARALSAHPALTAWLYRATQFTAIDLVRAEQRRRNRELEAQAMREVEVASNGSEWQEAARPILDDALTRLEEEDRNAIALRVLEGESFIEVGRRLNISENTARMRVTRALEKVRAHLAERGVTSTAAALSACLSSQASVTAPVGLAAAIGAGAAATVPIALAIPIFMASQKTAVAVAGALVLLVGSGIAMQEQEIRRVRAEIQTLASTPVNIEPPVPTPATAVDPARITAAEANRAALVLENQKLEREFIALQQSNPEAWTKAPILDPSKLSRIPIARTQAKPEATPAERNALAGERYTASVEFIVDIDGHVRLPKVVNSVRPEIERIATEAVSKWEFSAPQKDQQAVNTHMVVDIVFDYTGAAAQAQPSRWF